MPTEKRVPRDYNKITTAEEYRLKELKKLLGQREVFNAFHDQLIAIIGPLTVKERWEFFGSIGLANMRQHVNLEGAAYIVASQVLRFAFGEYSYPYNIAILQAISDISGLGDHADILMPFLLEFTEPESNSN